MCACINRVDSRLFYIMKVDDIMRYVNKRVGKEAKLCLPLSLTRSFMPYVVIIFGLPWESWHNMRVLLCVFANSWVGTRKIVGEFRVVVKK